MFVATKMISNPQKLVKFLDIEIWFGYWVKFLDIVIGFGYCVKLLDIAIGLDNGWSFWTL